MRLALLVTAAIAGAFASGWLLGRDSGRSEVHAEMRELVVEQLEHVEELDPKLEQLWARSSSALDARLMLDDKLRHLGRDRRGRPVEQ